LAVKKRQVAAEIYSNGPKPSSLGNSRGLFAALSLKRIPNFHHRTGRLCASWAKATPLMSAAFDPHKLAERLARKRILLLNRARASPGRYTVILEPAQVLDLVGFLFYDFSATALQDKRSA